MTQCVCGSYNVTKRENGVPLPWMPKDVTYHCNCCGNEWH